jgi:hypothetical protein
LKQHKKSKKEKIPGGGGRINAEYIKSVGISRKFGVTRKFGEKREKCQKH